MGSSAFESVSGQLDREFLTFHTRLEDPIALARKWMQEAINEQVREPRSMVLTTASSRGEMSSRIMATLSPFDKKIMFATHSCSRKGQDVESNPVACAHFYWKELGRQLSISGKVVKQPHEAAKLFWDKRPTPLHAMSTVSNQSEPLMDSEELRLSAESFDENEKLPCPDRFSVYELVPLSIEFWAASSDRLHRRLRVELVNGEWHSTWLQP